MGDPVDLTSKPTFTAREIEIFSDPGNPNLIRVVGHEQLLGGCSFYTTNTTKATLNKGQLEKLRDALVEVLAKLP